MAYRRAIKLNLGFKKPTVGWNIYFSHKEANDISDGAVTLAAILAAAGVTGGVASAVAAGGFAFKTICAVGGHDGVKVVVTLVPLGAIALPR